MNRVLWLSRALVFAAAAALAACDKQPSGIFEAVHMNDRSYVMHWLEGGGNPNTVSGSKASLLYIATGPKGGNDVLALLLEACANPNLGAYGYTPLMNAASWVNLPAVELLLTYGADPQQRNEKGQTAIDVVGLDGGREQAVIARLRKEMVQHRAASSKPSIEWTCHSRLRLPRHAAHAGVDRPAVPRG